jgi:hypothetical protein
MTAERAMTGWRRAALANGRKRRVEFIVGSVGWCRLARGCGASIGAERVLARELAYRVGVRKPGEMVLDGWWSGKLFGGVGKALRDAAVGRSSASRRLCNTAP